MKLRIFHGDLLVGIVESVSVFDSSGYVLCIVKDLGGSHESWIHHSQLFISA